MNTILIGILLILTGGCIQQTKQPDSDERVRNIPKAYPLPDSLRNPDELAVAQIRLGQQLFFDKRLSADAGIACAGCHKPEYAFGDNLPLSAGKDGMAMRRNTPPLFNLWRHNRFFRDGGVSRLSEVALSAMNEVHELNLPIDTLVRRLRALPEYVRAFQETYRRPPDPYTVTQALMRYQQSLISADSPYDRYRYRSDSTALSTAARRGMQLYFSDATHCKTCHAGPDFTDGLFHHNGIPEGAMPDTGRARITMRWIDYARFRTPSLRNLSYTAPYMHDGRYSTLMEVLQHYNRTFNQTRGESHPIDLPLTGRNLTEGELNDLQAFLLHLNDSSFIRSTINHGR